MTQSLDVQIEVRPFNGGFGIFENGADQTDPLCFFADANNAQLALSEFIVRPELLIQARMTARLTNAIYDLVDATTARR